MPCFQAENDHMRDDWLSVLHAAIAVAQGTVPPASLDALNVGLPLLSKKGVEAAAAAKPARARKARVSLLDGKVKQGRSSVAAVGSAGLMGPPPPLPPPPMPPMDESDEG